VSQDEYETELTGNRADIAAAIHGVADGVLAGAIRLGDDADSVTVETPESLSLEIELESDDNEVSLELELEWGAGAVDAAEAGSDEESPDTETALTDTAEERPDGEVEAEIDRSHDSDDRLPEASTIPAAAADASQSLAQFEVFRDRREEWRWRLRHRNGNVIATSGEGYTRKHNASKGLQSVMANSPKAAVVEESTE